MDGKKTIETRTHAMHNKSLFGLKFFNRKIAIIETPGKLGYQYSNLSIF